MRFVHNIPVALNKSSTHSLKCVSTHQLRTLSPDAVVLSYVGSTETTCGESHLSGTYNATTTWVRRNGRWLVQIHTETPILRP